MEIFDKAIAVVAAIGIITAIGLHSSQLAQLAPAAGKASSGVLHTAETGNA
jgi:hypothetical protein